jgi:glycosyltransferase involved in cell wall biosynthesis
MPVFYGRLTQFTDQDHDGIPDTLDPHFHFLKELKNHHLYFNPLRNPLIRRYLNQTQVITVSHALEQVFQVNGIHVHQVIHNGVDVNLWKAHPAKITAFRKKYSLQGKPVLLLAGRIRPDKGSLLAIRILNQLPKNTVLLLAGKKDRGVAQALDYAQSLDIKPRVIPTGFLSQPQLNTAYHAANAILVPSLYLDPFPTVVIEGMACQKVVITTSFGGAREAIEQRKTGLIINPFNLSQTAKEIYKVLIQPNKYNQLAIRAFQTAQNRLSLKKQISSYLRAYTTSNYGN